MATSRNSEIVIWSTRLQRELLQLTTITEPESTDEKDDISANQKQDESMSPLPPFISFHDHILDLTDGICKVTFRVKVEKQKKEESKANDVKEEAKVDDLKEGPKLESTEDGSVEDDIPKASNETTDISDSEEPNYVLLTFDASMQAPLGSKGDENNTIYPFQKPVAILSKGASLFSSTSMLKDGDFLDVDCDWTPSLHLVDAAINVSLQVRESIRRNEPFIQSHNSVEDNSSLDATLKNWGIDWKSSAKKSSSEPSPEPPHQAKEIRIGDIINLSGEPFNKCVGMHTIKAIRRPEFVAEMMAEAKRQAADASVHDEEDGEVPASLGNYMKLQAGSVKKVGLSGLAGAGFIFKSIYKSTKSALEESSLMITDDHILELRSNKFSIGSANVVFISPISLLAKLKFRRQESISLFFKQAPDDPLIYLCQDSANCVQQIQAVLKQHGVKGKHTNASTQRAVQVAIAMVVNIQEKEKLLADDPNIVQVNEIMDMYRQAAEKFENSGDARHQEVMSHMHKFLAKPLIVSILDGSYDRKQRAHKEADPFVPKGEVLECTTDQIDDHSDDEASVDNAAIIQQHQGDKLDDTMKQANDILEEAKRDMAKYDIDGEDDFDGLDDGSGDSDKESVDSLSEINAMLSAADKELSDLMES